MKAPNPNNLNIGDVFESDLMNWRVIGIEERQYSKEVAVDRHIRNVELHVDKIVILEGRSKRE